MEFENQGKRKIKFRTWDEKNKTMVVVKDLSFVHGELVEINTSTYVWFKENFGSIELMQFTGLKDKNGKEIYEGDVVQFKNKYMKQPNILGYVKFDVGRGSYTFTETLEDNYYGLTIVDSCDNGICDSENIEVIGNIYENPELLK